MTVTKMINILLHHASVFRCGRQICSLKSMERSLVGFVYGFSCLSVFVTISCFGEMGSYLSVRVPSVRRIYRRGELLISSHYGMYFVQLFK